MIQIYGSLVYEIQTPCFGYEKKLIIAKNTELFIKSNKKKLKTEVYDMKSKLYEYLSSNFEMIKDTIILIFIEEKVEKTELTNFIEKKGILCNFEYQKPRQIQERIKSITKAYKVNIDNQTLSYFIESCGTSMQELINEIRKLIEFAGENGTITREDIDILCIKKIESIIFDLTDNLGKKNVGNAMEIQRNLILNKEPVQKILITLYNHFKKLYLTKLALKSNTDIIYALDLKANQTFLVNKYKTQAGYFKTSEIRTIMSELCELDYKYKIGLVDLNIGLESILCTYCS